jgi:rod shape-determining protein MreD
VTPAGPGTVAAKGFLVIVLALTLQTALVADIRIFGAIGDVMLLVGIAAGIAGGAERGAAFGFAAGLALDLVQPDIPFGLSALAYCIIGYLVGSMQGSVLRASWWIPVLTAVSASAGGVILYVVLGQVVGQQTHLADALPIVVVVALLNGVLCLAAVRLLRWVGGGDRGPRLGAALR